MFCAAIFQKKNIDFFLLYRNKSKKDVLISVDSKK